MARASVVGTLCLSITAFGLIGTQAYADNVESFYHGKTISLVLATGPGGGYEVYGQLIARYMPKYMPGHPKIVIQYMPGAGGVTAADFMSTLAPKDGTMMSILSNDAPGFQVLDGRGVRYDASKFAYIGRAASMQYVVVVWHTAGVRTISDMKSHEIVFGTTGPSQSSYTLPLILNRMFGFKTKILMGYQTTNQINIALENGEVTGRAAAWSSIYSRRPDWFKNGTVIPVVQSGAQRDVDLPNVPLLQELAKSDEKKQMLKVITSDAAVGRAVNFPPGVPADRVQAARTAFAEAMKDPQLLADAKKVRVPIELWSGEELQNFVGEVIQTPKATLAKARAILQSGDNATAKAAK